MVVKDVDLNFVIPLVIHGDDAEAHRRRSFLVTTLGSCLTDGSVWSTKFLLYCLDNSRATTETIKTLDTWVAWSLLELQCGTFLDRDPFDQQYQPFLDGRQGNIAGKYRAVLAVHKGDEKYLQKVYAMTHSATSAKVCFRCHAESSGRNLYTFYGPNAPHRVNMLSTEEFIRSACGQQSWTRLPGWSVSVLYFDYLHVIDLTVVPECAASVTWSSLCACAVFETHDLHLRCRYGVAKALVELTETDIVWSAPNIDERLRLAFVQFTTLCKQHKVRTLLAA